MDRRQADGTWEQTGDNMRAAAQEVFAAHPDKEHVIATVIEHGGWHLTFAKSGHIVGTANDTAVFSEAAREYCGSLAGAEWRYLPEVWRGRQADATV